ncbi:MAG: helix-turn-helix domain-containing protein [Alistipes communis]
MKSEGLTSSRLAEILGTGASNISHIISGRSKPGYDLLRKILLSFPQINPDWLLLDDETMYRSDETPIREQPVSPDLLRQNPQLPNILPVPLTKPISPEIRIPSTRSIRIGSLPEILEI